jgi:ATP-dependent RNA helicase RhlE
MSFEVFGLAEPLVRAVSAAGYTQPTPIQAQAIPPVLEGRDLLGSAQTGTGKTAAFALPVLHRMASRAVPANRPIRVLVLSPTRELAAQIGESFREYGKFVRCRHTVIFGGVGQGPQTRDLERGVDIVVATPGRLCDLMDQGYVELDDVEVFILDEADRMLDMGFLPDLKKVIAELPEKRQTLLFSATFPTAIAELAESILTDPVRVKIAPVKATTELIDQAVSFVPQPQKAKALASVLKDPEVTRAIVFTRTKHGADRVVVQLAKAGIRAEAIHGNKSQNARQRSLANFKSDRTKVLVATDLAARGIDVDNISHVINYDLPNEPETYVHRIGRTGRAGANGLALSFCDPSERKYLKFIERLIRKTIPVRQLDLPAGPVTAGPPIVLKEEPVRTPGPKAERHPHQHRRPQRPGGRPGKPGHRGRKPAGRRQP